VLTVLHEKNIAYELVTVNIMKGEQKTPEHLARQPYGKVPVLQDGDFHLYESQAICRYLDKKSGAKLVPADLKQAALVDQWVSNFSSYYNDNIMKIVFQRLFSKFRGVQPDEAVCAKALEDLHQTLPILDKHLAHHQFVAGEFSFADVMGMPFFNYLFPTPEGKIIFEQYKHVREWFVRVGERPSWQKIRADMKALEAKAAEHK
jgi:glutathione S-transferase